MNNKHIVLEDMIEFTKPVITVINLVTKTNFKSNEGSKRMFKATLDYLESYLKVNDSNKKGVKEAIEFNLFHSLFIENQDSEFTFREKSNFIFDILDMKSSEIYNIIIECIDFIEKDIRVRDKVFN